MKTIISILLITIVMFGATLPTYADWKGADIVYKGISINKAQDIEKVKAVIDKEIMARAKDVSVHNYLINLGFDGVACEVYSYIAGRQNANIFTLPEMKGSRISNHTEWYSQTIKINVELNEMAKTKIVYSDDLNSKLYNLYEQIELNNTNEIEKMMEDKAVSNFVQELTLL